MAENTYSVVQLSSWTDYKKFISKLSDNWAFRGQSSAAWQLQNAIERTDFIHFYKGVEADFLAEFQRGARNYLNKDETPEHIIEWLALMQHHGAPTRLLDFSKSPFIAAYFAFEQCMVKEDHQVAIWAINIDYLRERALEVIADELAEDLKLNENLFNERLFQKIFFTNNRNLVFPVEPFRMNRRYSLQQSIFVSTGTSDEPFMKQLAFLGDAIAQAVIKIEVSSLHQKEVLRDLQKMNLHRASLFPDLDGYALSLKLRYNSMKTPDELNQEQENLRTDENFDFLP
ncbi:MAG: FRG domain-containing protein [Bacteroidota bacterium]|nr:FRG domain-containing protein [Flavisolibacter sp.]MBD0296950.1 FRG domain-containing protein [Flavisolibacter sp.]MBD0364931.1 FRG domain-containing protein [Flavisolibacter sp.]MBD0374158.1 FRG domain-containing protein [Flavisolibacter sp.]MDQ3843282.1 FRG domain-containing protein [Bacteroidota bacterium]